MIDRDGDACSPSTATAKHSDGQGASIIGQSVGSEVEIVAGSGCAKHQLVLQKDVFDADRGLRGAPRCNLDC